MDLLQLIRQIWTSSSKSPSSCEPLATGFSKNREERFPQKVENHVEKLPHELLLLIFEAYKNPIEGYTFVKAVSPRLDKHVGLF